MRDLCWMVMLLSGTGASGRLKRRPIWCVRCSPRTMPCGPEWEWLLSCGPSVWLLCRDSGPKRWWRAGSSVIARTPLSGRICSRSEAQPRRRMKWSARGPRNCATTTTAPTDAAAFAAITRRSSGATLRKWDAPWPEAAVAKCGSATTIRQETGPAGDRIKFVLSLSSETA